MLLPGNNGLALSSGLPFRWIMGCVFGRGSHSVPFTRGLSYLAPVAIWEFNPVPSLMVSYSRESELGLWCTTGQRVRKWGIALESWPGPGRPAEGQKLPLGSVLTRVDTGEKSILLLSLTERILIPQQAQELSQELVLGTETPLFRPYSKPEGTGWCPSSLQAANRVSLRNAAKDRWSGHSPLRHLLAGWADSAGELFEVATVIITFIDFS